MSPFPPPRVASLLLAALLAGSVAAQEPAEPLETDLVEEVEVRFVILDALVTDSHERIVTDLGVEEFELYLDLQPHPVASVDLNCSAGAAEEPEAVGFGELREPPQAEGPGRRFAFVIDYHNLPQTRRTEVVELVTELVRNNHATGDRLMLAAITNRLRIEQPFTHDPEEIAVALRRMNDDESLWQEQHELNYHEFNLYDGLTALVRLLGSYDGSKAVVLFSDMPSKVEDAPFHLNRPLLAHPIAFDYDQQHQEMATAATDARVAIYPVRASGLSLKGESDRLARLAAETGGRYTRYTNDLSLAYARAQRDLGCRYAVGFYDSKPEQSRVRRVNLKSSRPGLRVTHPILYRFGSDKVARASLSDTAYTAPSAFEDEQVTGGVIPIRPVSSKRWLAAVVLRFPVDVPGDGAAVVRFGAKLDDAARHAVDAFDSQVRLEGRGETSRRTVVVVEPAELRPGDYELSLVVNDPGVGEPRAAVIPVTIPPLRGQDLLVTGPILLRQATEEVIVSWGEGFAPLEAQADGAVLEPVVAEKRSAGGPLLAETRICRVAGGKRSERVLVGRTIVDADGAVIAELDSRELELTGIDESGCAAVVDELTVDGLPRGDYRLRVRARLAAGGPVAEGERYIGSGRKLPPPE